MDHFDFVLVGGGLQNSLIALALNRRRPGLRVALVERAERLGGNHTWCFHAGDFTSDTAALIEPLVVRRWPGYEVHFPQLYRFLDEPIRTLDQGHPEPRTAPVQGQRDQAVLQPAADQHEIEAVHLSNLCLA